MATVRFYVGVDMSFFANSGTTFHDTISGGTVVIQSPEAFVVDEGPSGRDYFYGLGLGAPSDNMPTTGTISEWAYAVPTDAGLLEVAWDFYDFSVAAGTFSGLVLSDDVDTLLANHIMSGSDNVYGSEYDDLLLGFGGNDLLIGGNGNDGLDGGGGSDLMAGGLGDDGYIVDNAGDDIDEEAGEGNDSVRLDYAPNLGTYTLGANLENLWNFSAQGLVLRGNDASNRITGSSGVDDFIYGMDGDDYLDGGGGGNDWMFGGAGIDTVTYANASGAVVVSLIAGSATGDGIDSFDSSIENIVGSAFADTLTGDNGSNSITGGAGNDVINGRGGADSLRGGAGNDIYLVDDAGDRAIELSAADGIDQVRSTVTFALGNHVEQLILSGTAAINGTGNALNNIISGNASNNVINGGAGADSLRGGAGNDTYTLDNVGDRIVETATGGIDRVNSSVDHVLGANVENLVMYGTAARGYGNDLANSIAGNAAANLLDGRGGNDALSGGAGDDRVYGGLGNDRLTGGAGADRFYFGTTLSSSTNVDRIIDFNVAEDTIMLAQSVFGAVANPGYVAAGSFVLGNRAQDADDRILYDSATGRIYYDADGNGALAAVLFATVAAGTGLTASDFYIVG